MSRWKWCTSKPTAWALPVCVVLLLSTVSSACAQRQGWSDGDFVMADKVLQHARDLIDKYNSREYYLLPCLDESRRTIDFTAAVPKEAVVASLTVDLLLGRITSAQLAERVRTLKTISDQAYARLRNMETRVRERRQKELDRRLGRQPTNDRTGGGPGSWRLKSGAAEVVNRNTSNTATETVESEVSATAMTYHYTRRDYQSRVVHEYTLSTTCSGLDAGERKPGEEFTFTLSGTWARGKDAGFYDGKGAGFECGGGVTVVSVDPPVPGKSAADAAGIAVGRMTSGADHASAQRTIRVKMPTSGTTCWYSVGIDPNHTVKWVFERPTK